MEERFVKSILSNQKCPHCGQHYEPTDAELLGHRDGVWFFIVCCPSCKTLGLTIAAINKAKAPELDTELTQGEKDKFSTPVNCNDVIDMHILLKGFSGDLSSLFSAG